MAHRNPSAPGGASQLTELRATVSLAIPIALVQLGMTGMGLVDTLMVGHVSARVLASVALGNVYTFTGIVLAQGTLMALDPIVAQAVGAHDEPAVSRALQRGMLLCFGLSVFIALLLLPTRWVLLALRQQADVIPDTVAYVSISVPGILPYLAFVVFRQTLQAMHKVRAIVWTMLVANLMNAGLNWVFVYGHLGSPPLGAEGSAVATLVSRWAMALLLLAGAWRDLEPHLLPVRPEVFDWQPLWRMLRLGLPIGAQQLLEVGAFAAIGLLMGTLGTVEMAAHQIAISLAAFTFMVPLGVSAAAAVRVGRAVGAHDAARARQAALASYVCGVGFMTLTALMFLGMPRMLAGAFTKESAVIGVAGILIPIAGVFQVFDGAQAVGAGVLRGLGDTNAPVIAMLAGYWLIGLPVSVVLGLHTPLRAAGLWWGFVASLSAVAFFLFLRVRVLFGRELTRLRIDDEPPLVA